MNNINGIFDLLDDWRNLPAYQLERRADIFFAIYLEDIINKKENATVDLIIPEFPLRLGELPDRDKKLNSSFKVDYLAYSKSRDIVYLIELKTDVSSLRPEQDKYYEGVKKIGIKPIINGIIKIYTASRQKKKYNNLIDKLVEVNWIKREGNKLVNIIPELSLKVMYIQPTNPRKLPNRITFDNVIEYISDSNDALTSRFIKSLKKWKLNPNN